MSEPALDPIHLPIVRLSAGGKPWGNWLGSEANDLSASTTKVKNACCYSSIPLFVRVSWCLMQFLRLLCVQPTMTWKSIAPFYVEIFFAYFQLTRHSTSFPLSSLYSSYHQKRDNRITTNGNRNEIKLNSILCKWWFCVWASTLNLKSHT